MAGGNVQEFLGGPRTLVPQLVNQRLAGCPRQEGSYHVGVCDVGELIALSGEVPDVPTEGFAGLLATVLEVPGVPRTLVRALEVPHKDLLQIRPTLDFVGRQVFQPRSCRIGQEQCWGPNTGVPKEVELITIER